MSDLSSVCPARQRRPFSANCTVVGTVAASDPDAGQALTYSMTAGNTGGAFAINATSGVRRRKIA